MPYKQSLLFSPLSLETWPGFVAVALALSPWDGMLAQIIRPWYIIQIG